MRVEPRATAAKREVTRLRVLDPQQSVFQTPKRRGATPRFWGLRLQRIMSRTEKNSPETFLIRRCKVILGPSLQAVPAASIDLDRIDPGANGGESDVEAARGSTQTHERPG